MEGTVDFDHAVLIAAERHLGDAATFEALASLENLCNTRQYFPIYSITYVDCNLLIKQLLEYCNVRTRIARCFVTIY